MGRWVGGIIRFVQPLKLTQVEDGEKSIIFAVGGPLGDAGFEGFERVDQCHAAAQVDRSRHHWNEALDNRVASLMMRLVICGDAYFLTSYALALDSWARTLETSR